MTLSDEEIRALLRVVLATDPVEIDCDELLARIAALFESLGPDGSIPAELALVSQHLALCAECREEFDALLQTCRSEDLRRAIRARNAGSGHSVPGSPGRSRSTTR